MALHEGRGEYSSELAQQKWLSRLARERHNLSASVEATLVDGALPGQWWQDNGEEFEEQGNQEAVRTTHRHSLIQPHLNLQSGPMPTVHSDGLVAESTHAHTATSVSAAADTQKRAPQSIQTANSVNMFARLTQRLTGSLAALGHVLNPDTSSSSASAHTEMVSNSSTSEVVASNRQVDLPMQHEQANAVEQAKQPLVRVLDVPSVVERPEEPVTSSLNVAPTQKKQRLAGRTTKVRLEVAPPAVPLPLAEPQAYESLQEDIREMSSAQLLALDVLRDCNGITSAHLPVPGKRQPEEIAKTSAHLPAIGALKGAVSATAGWTLSGTGSFETGQQEATIANEHITEVSVVLVVLTSDPGPVVVQYVSLQPQRGFTVHLTAPAITKTSFNYVIFLGDM